MSRHARFQPVMFQPPMSNGRRWVDVHNHLLPGLDDGPRDWDAALTLCRAMVRQGVTHACATPHLFGPYTEPDRVATILCRTARLAELLAEAEIPLALYQGADVRIDCQWERALAEGGVLTLGRGGQYILVEPPHDVWIESPMVCQVLDAAAYVGVLTHPERHPHVQRCGAGVLQDWVNRGVILQITAGSLLGDFGSKAERIAWDIIESPVKAIVASDAHGADRRPPRIGDAAREITRRLSPADALRLCSDVPWSLIADTVPATQLPVTPSCGKAVQV